MRLDILEYCGEDECQEELFVDECFDDCLLGITCIGSWSFTPAYDFNKMIDYIKKNNNLSESEAIEHFNLNILDKKPKIAFVRYVNESNMVLSEYNEDMLFLDGFDNALVGIRIQKDYDMVAVYEDNKCISILIDNDGMDEEEAIEYFEYNVRGSYVGEHTPALLTLF